MNSQHTKKLNYGINTAFFLCGCHLHTTSLNWYFFQSFDAKIINKSTNVISLTRNLSRWHPLKVLFPIFSNSVKSCRKLQTPLDLNSLQVWTQPGDTLGFLWAVAVCWTSFWAGLLWGNHAVFCLWPNMGGTCTNHKNAITPVRRWSVLISPVSGFSWLFYIKTHRVIKHLSKVV